MGPALIVNADDYGFTPAVSAGIRAAHRDGIVTSTTVLSVAPTAPTELRAAITDCPGLGIGVHLTLTGGWRPLLGRRVPTLRGRRGRLPTSAALSTVLRRADPKEVRDEWRAQIEAVIDAGVDPDHLDAHHHIAYRSQRLLEVLLELAGQYALPVRLPVPASPEAGVERPARPTGPTLLPAQLLRELASAHGSVHPDHLIAGFGSGATRGTLLDLLDDLAPGEVAELMCHPGKVDWRLRARSSYTTGRVKELAILTDDSVRLELAARSVRLTTFARA